MTKSSLNVRKKAVMQEIKNFYKGLPKNFYKNPNWIVPIGGGYYDEKEVIATTTCYLDGLLSTQRTVVEFENHFSAYIGVKHGIAVNSGTSANILAFDALIQSGALKKGDEVALPATTFISVATPIVQLGLKPVYVDIDKATLNMDMKALENALKKSNKIKCVIIVHTLGCPADMTRLMNLKKKYSFKVIEDCCEAHGAKHHGKRVGSFGDIATWSFYVAHNMTTAEGGMICTNSNELSVLLRDLREFGRDRTFKGKRYGYTGAGLKDFDERYTFHKVGWNFRMADAPAAFGLEQLKKLEKMNGMRIKNAEYLHKKLSKFLSILILPPLATKTMSHTYYTFPIVIKDKRISRGEFARFLESKKIETRAIMCGTLSDQPALHKAGGREDDALTNSRYVRDNGFSIGCHPLLSKSDLDHVVLSVTEFLTAYVK